MNELYSIQSCQLNDLFKNYFIVCYNNVQRDFVWNVDKCRELLCDILNENDRYYGINTMGFSFVDETSRKIECYDGQQRLTTYSLLIVSLYFFIDEYISNENEKKKKVLRMLKSLILKSDYSTYEENLVFIPNDGNSQNIITYEAILKLEKNSEFEKYVIDNKSQSNKYVKIIMNFIEEFGNIYNNIDEYYDSLNLSYKNNNAINISSDDKFILSLVNSIVNKPVIIMYIGSETDNKYKQFINQMKGEKLVPSQFFETRLNELKNTADELQGEKIDEFLEMFNRIKYISDDNGDYMPNDNLIKYLMFYKTYKNHRINNELVNKVFSEYGNFYNVSDIDEAIRITQIFIDLLKLKENGKTEYLDESNSHYDKIYEKLHVINNVLKIRDTLNPIIILLFIKYGDDYGKICEYLDPLVKYGFLEYKIFNDFGNVDIRPIVAELINIIANDGGVDLVKNVIKREIDKHCVTFGVSYFDKINRLKDVKYFNESNINKELIKFILLEYYKSQEDDDSEELAFNKLSIEHIIPKKYENNYDYLKLTHSTEEIESAINSIGNQLLLVLKANQKISNKGITEKLVYYKKSKFNVNLDFVNTINHDNHISLNNIFERHSMIIDFVGKYFEVV